MNCHAAATSAISSMPMVASVSTMVSGLIALAAVVCGVTTLGPKIQYSVPSAMIATAMRLLAKRFGAPPELNLWVRTAPHGAEFFAWHVDIAPRLTIKAGFELGTGVDINIYPPEQAASDLRDCL